MRRPLLALVVALLPPCVNAAEATDPNVAPKSDSAAAERARLNAIADLVGALRVLRSHLNGTKPATDTELATARATLKRLGAKEPTPESAALKSPSSSPAFARIKAPEVDLNSVAAMFKIFFKTEVTVSDRLREKVRVVNVILDAESAEDLDRKFRAALAAHGIHVIDQPDGKLLDTEPAPEKTP